MQILIGSYDVYAWKVGYIESRAAVMKNQCTLSQKTRCPSKFITESTFQRLSKFYFLYRNESVDAFLRDIVTTFIARKCRICVRATCFAPAPTAACNMDSQRFLIHTKDSSIMTKGEHVCRFAYVNVR